MKKIKKYQLLCCFFHVTLKFIRCDFKEIIMKFFSTCDEESKIKSQHEHIFQIFFPMNGRKKITKIVLNDKGTKNRNFFSLLSIF